MYSKYRGTQMAALKEANFYDLKFASDGYELS